MKLNYEDWLLAMGYTDAKESRYYYNVYLQMRD